MFQGSQTGITPTKYRFVPARSKKKKKFLVWQRCYLSQCNMTDKIKFIIFLSGNFSEMGVGTEKGQFASG